MPVHDDPSSLLQKQLRVLQREAHHLRAWEPATQPAFLAQQVQNRAVVIGVEELAASCERRLARASDPHALLLWSAGGESPELIRTLVGHEEPVTAVAVTPEGSRAVSASEDRTLKVWDLASGRCEATVALESKPRCVALCPDG